MMSSRLGRCGTTWRPGAWIKRILVEQWDVSADVAAPIGHAGDTTIMVKAEFNEFHQLRREVTGSWVNEACSTGVEESQGGRKVKNSRLHGEGGSGCCFHALEARDYPASGHKGNLRVGHFESCENVKYTFLVDLEMMSRTGIQVLTKYFANGHAK